MPRAWRRWSSGPGRAGITPSSSTSWQAPRRRSVFLDIDFSALSNPFDDALLESALAKPRDFPVVLPTFFQYASGTDESLVVSQPRLALRAQRRIAPWSTRSPGAMASRAPGAPPGACTAIACPASSTASAALPDDQDVLIDFSISPASFTYVSYVDVLEGRVPREVFAGKTVFVGATARGTRRPAARADLPIAARRRRAGAGHRNGATRRAAALPAWARLALLALWTALAALLFFMRGDRWLAQPRGAGRCRWPPSPALSLYAFRRTRLWLEAGRAAALAVDAAVRRERGAFAGSSRPGARWLTHSACAGAMRCSRASCNRRRTASSAWTRPASSRRRIRRPRACSTAPVYELHRRADREVHHAAGRRWRGRAARRAARRDPRMRCAHARAAKSFRWRSP